ncbi:DNA repair ATPase [Desulfococcaceae bacterium HSG7]|nr:DNA repair ATPase [Desulfococcaceae bacterium HSG7]
MAQTEKTDTSPETAATLDGGTYEILRSRLLKQGTELRTRLDKLNQSRKDIFGSVEQTLLATERISTHNNCTPRDMASINGNQFVFGYNVHIGLRSELQLADVFAIYSYNEKRQFREISLDRLHSGRFEDDFKDLYRYYKATRFAKFSVIGPHLFMVFRIGKSSRDIKVFKWLLQDNKFTYIDNRSEQEYKFPPQHDFTWSRTSRDWHRYGEHPHVSIQDRLFVEAVGGDITFKIEDNTDSGQGIYAEPVDNPDQTLDDAEIHFALLGHIILVRIRPYQEERFRYFIFNEKTQEAHRADEIENACVFLPDDQGLVFSNGYYLQTGELKQFETDLADMMFERRLASPNGEDFLYIFYNRESGDHILLSYNLIEQKMATPLLCNGFSCFDNGELLFFRAEEQPSKHHVIQIWQTPYMKDDFTQSEKSDSLLYKVGNPDIVRCMAECNELLKTLNREDLYEGLYIDLLKNAGDIADSYFWIDKKVAFNLKEVILEIKDAAAAAIEAFEKVVRLKKSTAEQVKHVSERAREILSNLKPEVMEHIDEFVQELAALRTVRGEIISLKELRYVDLEAIDALETEVKAASEQCSEMCVEFLLKPEALAPYQNRVAAIGQQIEKAAKATEADNLQKEADDAADELEMLIEIVSNLKIEDSTHTTRIIDDISGVFSTLNQVKASIKNRKKSLLSKEGAAQFSAQMKLLNQSVVNYLDISDTPEKCDEYLTKVMITLEETESHFADFDDFIIQLSEKRAELYNAFESKKLNLIETRNKKANALMSAAERIIKGVQNRAESMDDINAINGYFASDLMIDKIRDIVSQLVDLNDSVKADDIQSRLKTVREDAVRQLKDRQELFVDGANVIKMGEHRFSVNVQPLDLTVVPRDGEQYFHLTGTDFFETVDDPAFLETRPVWNMEVISENKQVYRAEYLAWQMLKQIAASDHQELARVLAFTDDERVEYVQQFMGPRYTEGYSKGVHDHDGAHLLMALVKMHASIGLLRFHPRVRALGRLFWNIQSQNQSERETPSLLAEKLRAFGMMRNLFDNQAKGNKTVQENYIRELTALMTEFVTETRLFQLELASDAAQYLFYELSGTDAASGERFVISKEAWDLTGGFLKHLKAKRFMDKFNAAREKISSVPAGEFELVRDWLKAYVSAHGLKEQAEQAEQNDYIDEAAVLIFTRKFQKSDVADVAMNATVTGMHGDHAVIQDGVYHLRYNAFEQKLAHYEREVAPMFHTYLTLKKELTESKREELRLDEFKPRILTSFVRNRLINQVYLPLTGDNLAKQIGVVGEATRTDRMGLLLLVSPPGYGKTTLMEYIANRLGIIFMKINGPAIGHKVTSLDPAEAPHASAREEMLKLNLALEMGDNIMLYLDDIQHCNPELLQKFISLCDAQRKIEGVYKGKSRTYDLRGKKVMVVMAGNPYTESGEKFKIPDMLSNRADTYNLGDIIGDTAEAFKLSYLENSLTSNAVLNTLSSRSQKDVYSIIRIAETGSREGVEFAGGYSVEEVSEMAQVMEKLIKVRDVILKVNLEYIHSASQAEEYRTEPPFKLQGSYRNMNRIAEKIVPIMNPEELKTLISAHYENESQTLTSDTEANLLKFKEMTGWADETEQQRWLDIKKTFRKNKLLHGSDAGDPINRVVAQLSAFQDGLESIHDVLESGVGTSDHEPLTTQIAFSEQSLSQMERLLKEMKTVLSAFLEKNHTDTASVNRLPDAYLKIMKKQFKIMKSWIEPLLKGMHTQSADMNKLAQSIGQMKGGYQAVTSQSNEDRETFAGFKAALDIDPHDDSIYYKRGIFWYNKNKLRQALNDFKNALDLKPKNKKYQRTVEHLEAELKKWVFIQKAQASSSEPQDTDKQG